MNMQNALSLCMCLSSEHLENTKIVFCHRTRNLCSTGVHYLLHLNTSNVFCMCSFHVFWTEHVPFSTPREHIFRVLPLNTFYHWTRKLCSTGVHYLLHLNASNVFYRCSFYSFQNASCVLQNLQCSCSILKVRIFIY